VTAAAASAPAPVVRESRRPGVGTVYRWELRKLVSLKRTYLGLGFAALMPLIFVVALAARNHAPNDVPFGRYALESGLAVPLVLLTFGSYWLFPLITALVAGDIIASEDQNGTLKTILTRSVERGHVFAGKALVAATYTVLALIVMALVALIAGGINAGWHSLISLSGTRVSVGRGLVLIAASFGIYLAPLLALASIGLLLSAVMRNSAAAVVGTLMFSLVLQLVAILPGVGHIKPYLLVNQFFAWHGFLRTPIDWAPIGHAAWVCALWAIPSLIAAYVVFLRRDVAGG
jgi:ABC-2 type transport system permease protein